jgi:nucleotide-binding universal stress UspA family protein
MLKRILVPLDGSERAERGLALAAQLARGSGGELLLARIVGLPPMPLAPYGEPAQIALALIAEARQEADEYLKNVAQRPLLQGIPVQARAIEGHVTADILNTARDERCDMIVITTHGYSGFNRWRLGRVAAQVARHAPAPVLIIPARDARAAQSAIGEADKDIRILVALDGSELAEAALAPALDVARSLAESERISVHLLEVVEFFAVMMADTTREAALSAPAVGAEEQALQAARDYLETVAQRIRQETPGARVTTAALLAADIATTIGEVAGGEPRYDFIAMATHGRGGLQRWALGSITERVLHTTHLPLIIARSPGAIAHGAQIAEAATDAGAR